MDISLAIVQLEEATEKCFEITDNKSTNNYEMSNLKQPQKVKLTQIYLYLIIKLIRIPFRAEWKKQALLKHSLPSLCEAIFLNHRGKVLRAPL
ncbi:hypothetical protein TNCT_24161 [Trichonephila clavata]|uniref:Uncharacterized protein n=1 Tax=Trichonephila clavata TaxID=2740835 RepID=A0A8X6HRQ2_TRICU|nr:hypothetical protein TNCT_24161 [Trichonephila clavata]